MTKTSRLVYDINDRKRDLKDKAYHIEQTKILWMPISVGQYYHETNYLEESINLILKNFKNINILNVTIIDTPQRYQLAIKNKKNPDALFKQAKKTGSLWKKKYQALFEKHFNQKLEFNQWEKVGPKHKTYKKAWKEIAKLCRNDKEFNDFLEEDVKEFENRHLKREGRSFTEKEKEYCRRCIKEECAALIVWDRSKPAPGYSCIFYPKKMITTMFFVKRNFTNFMSVYAELHPNKISFPNKNEIINFDDDISYKTSNTDLSFLTSLVCN